MAQVEIIAAKKRKNEEIITQEKKRVCAYARVSTDSEEQLTSYTSQIKYYKEYIKSKANWTFVGIYADEGISGTQIKNRDGFQKMIEEAIDGKIDIIIAKSISRFARNTLDTLKYVRLLREYNVDIHFEKENIHTLDLDSEMFLTLYSAFAQAESESTSANVTMGFIAKMKRGEIVGNAACYGFVWNKEKHKLQINEEESEIVKMIFHYYIDGYGTRKIAEKLNTLNIVSPKGTKWCQSTVARIIAQEKYVGDLIEQKYYTINPLTHKQVKNNGEKAKYYIKNHHDAIIDRKTWEQAQEIQKQRKRKIEEQKNYFIGKYRMRYPFSNKMECSTCHAPFQRRVGSTKKDGKKTVYWACANRLKNKNLCSHKEFIEDAVVQKIFIKIYNKMVENKYKTKKELYKTIKEIVYNTEYKKRNKLNREKDILKKRLSSLLDMKLDGYIDKKNYLKKEKELNNKLLDIRNKIDKIKENKDILNEIEKVINEPYSLNTFDR